MAPLWVDASAAAWTAAWGRYDAVLASLQVNFPRKRPRHVLAPCLSLNASSFCLPTAQPRATTRRRPCVKQKDELVALDEWFQVQLPGQLHARDPTPFITHVELTRLMEWKLKKGKWCVGCALL
jgi:hypothetical protein